MPSERQGRSARPPWPLWSGLVVTVVVAAWSCGIADDRPPNRAALPASSADRAIARAERAARARARAEQDPATSVAKPKSKPAAKPPPAPPSEPEPEDAGAPDADPPDAEAPDATAVDADAGSAPDDAGPADPAELCQRTCDKVIACMRTLVGGADLPPGIDEERLTNKVRQKCLAECSAEIDDHVDEARACLEIEDCGDFLDCIKKID